MIAMVTWLVRPTRLVVNIRLNQIGCDSRRADGGIG
jgi:hypothetical protein